MVTIIGNNIAQIINQKVSKEEKPDEARQQILDALMKYIPRNRLNNLIKGTFSLNISELFIIRAVLECESLDEIVILRTDRS